jgi:hypothetical protein
MDSAHVVSRSDRRKTNEKMGRLEQVLASERQEGEAVLSDDLEGSETGG